MCLPPGTGNTAAVDQRNFINAMMSGNFEAMQRLGDDVLLPFLRDVPQFSGLGKTLVLYAASKPLMIPSLVQAVGIGNLVNWLGHFFTLGLFALASDVVTAPTRAVAAKLPPRLEYRARRWLEQLQYGSGRDYHHD